MTDQTEATFEMPQVIARPMSIGPGTVLVHAKFPKELRTVARRKEDNSGWWLTDDSGLSDWALSRYDDWLVYQETKLGKRVADRQRFGQPGTVLAIHRRWAWVMWDEYPIDHEPSVHLLDTLKVLP